jgi:hypothetical protein
MLLHQVKQTNHEWRSHTCCTYILDIRSFVDPQIRIQPEEVLQYMEGQNIQFWTAWWMLMFPLQEVLEILCWACQVPMYSKTCLKDHSQIKMTCLLETTVGCFNVHFSCTKAPLYKDHLSTGTTTTWFLACSLHTGFTVHRTCPYTLPPLPHVAAYHTIAGHVQHECLYFVTT